MIHNDYHHPRYIATATKSADIFQMVCMNYIFYSQVTWPFPNMEKCKSALSLNVRQTSISLSLQCTDIILRFIQAIIPVTTRIAEEQLICNFFLKAKYVL